MGLETENVQLGILVTKEQDLISTTEKMRVPRAFSTKNLVRLELRVCRTVFDIPLVHYQQTSQARKQTTTSPAPTHLSLGLFQLYYGLGGHMVNQPGNWFAFLNIFNVSQLPFPTHHMTTSMEHETVMAAPA